jgi:hypothetical protein
MNFRSGDEGANAAAPLNDSFAFEGSQSVARSHQADQMDSRKIPLGIHGIPGTQMSGFDALADGVLDLLVGRNAITTLVHDLSSQAWGRHVKTSGPSRRTDVL